MLAAGRLLIETSLRCLESLQPDINLSEFRALAILVESGPQRLIDIADSLSVTSTTATRLADGLAEHGLVERVRLSRDRREVHLSISAAGRALVGAVTRRRRDLVASALEQFSSRDQQLALSVLCRLVEPAAKEEKDSA